MSITTALCTDHSARINPMIRVLLETNKHVGTALSTSTEIPVEIITHGGVSPSAWYRRNQHDTFIPMQGTETLNPIVPDILFRTFDLQMPYVHWQNYLYVGPDRIGRAGGVQVFNMYPPPESPAALAGVGLCAYRVR